MLIFSIGFKKPSQGAKKEAFKVQNTMFTQIYEHLGVLF